MGFGRRCGGTPEDPRECCQGVTSDGNKCRRLARVKLDLRKQRQIGNFKIPRVNCCFYCYQHAAAYTGIAAAKISELIATSQLDWDEYIILNPEYIEDVGK